MTRAATVLAAMIAATASLTYRPVLHAQQKPPVLGTFGIDTTAMDTSVRPGDDFYRYVNGGWLATARIPADRARFGVFDRLSDQAELDVRAIVEELIQAPQAPGSVRQKVADFYRAWMDAATIERRGLEPLQADLGAIRAARTPADLARLMGRRDYAGPVRTYIQPDPADPTRYTVGVSQAGLGMPNRDYYLTSGPRFDAYRGAYRTYVTRVLELLGDPAPGASADAVVALETKLANVHWTPERQRDVRATYNPVDRAGLRRMAPGFDWDATLASSGLDRVDRFVVEVASAVRDGVALVQSEPVEAWRAYLAFHLASSYAAYLPKAFDEANFAFSSKALRGVEVQRDRWKRGIGLLDAYLGEGVGELYVARHFPPAHKAAMDELVRNLRTAMGERLKTLPWMDDPTRAAAQQKLAAFDPRIGYPEHWRDYSALAVDASRMFENVRNARMFEWNRRLARFDRPVDRTEWGMTPQTVNAYYNPSMNQITFPAAILQAPFFDPNADPAVNYGAIGAVIGHEMGHGFDDQGREYDGEGRLRDWWTPLTTERFLEQTRRLAAQYDAVCPLEGMCVNGRLTMGENIGDLGGLEMAYTAYKLSLKGKEAPVLDGFTGDQRFFLAHAQVWRALAREDQLRNQLLTDPHAPPAARGSVPERNMDAWYRAFDVKPGDRQYIRPEDRVRIW